MAWQGRRLRDPGPRGDARLVDAGVVFECRRPAAVRDGAAPLRPRLPPRMLANPVIGELLIVAGPGEWRAAWVEDGETLELYVERGDTKPPGSRHLGRVVRIVSALDAALVDIGDERPGFLPLREVPEGVMAAEGARLVVEVRREAWQDKAPRLTAKIAEPALTESAAPSAPPA